MMQFKHSRKVVVQTVLVVSFAFLSNANGRTIHVAVNADDANPGTKAKPVGTLYRARDLAREVAGKQPVEIIVAGGTYYLDKPLVLSARDSGTKEAPVVWRAAEGQKVRLVGGRRLNLKWEPHTDRIYRAAVPKGTEIDRLFVNGRRMILARYPNYDASQRYYCGYGATAERMKGWKKPEEAYIHALHKAKWGSGHIVLRRDEGGKLYEYMVSIDTTTQGNGATLNQELRFAENVFEELDSDGEWYLSIQVRTRCCGAFRHSLPK